MPNVNLVFHGVFAMILHKESIDIRFPYFTPHEYLFGCWDELEPMPKGRIQMKGVNGIRGCTPELDFRADRSPTVRNLPQCCDENLFCRLHLSQYPSAVNYFRPYSLPQIEGKGRHRFPFFGVHGDGINIDALYGPVVLTYHADNISDVELIYREDSLAYTQVVDPRTSTMNLHFFAEGETDLPPEGNPDRPYQVGIHYPGAWSKLTSLIASLDIRLKPIYPFVVGRTEEPQDPTGVIGLPASQLWDLDELFAAKHNPEGPIFGGDTDCDKAHVVIDNR